MDPGACVLHLRSCLNRVTSIARGNALPPLYAEPASNLFGILLTPWLVLARRSSTLQGVGDIVLDPASRRPAPARPGSVPGSAVMSLAARVDRAPRLC